MVTKPISIHEDESSIPGLAQWVAVSNGTGHRCGWDPALLWHRSAAVAMTRPLAWELPYATGAAPPKKKN